MLRIFAAIVALCAPFAALILFVDAHHALVLDPRRASWRTIRNCKVICVAALVLLALSAVANARPSPYPSAVTQFNGDRYAATAQMGADVARAVKAKRSAHKRAPVARKTWRRVPVPRARPLTSEPYRVETPISLGEGVRREASRIIGGRPAGCPHAFCGCGASLHLFGRIIPALNLAANWLRFPRAVPAPDMVAARRGHVFVLKRHIAGNTWLVHDSNSGHGRTRVHPRSIAGYQIVNPHGAS